MTQIFKKGTVLRRLYHGAPNSLNAWIEPGMLGVVDEMLDGTGRWRVRMFADPDKFAAASSEPIGYYWEVVNDANT